MSPVGIHNTCSFALCDAFPSPGFHKCQCGTIVTTFSQDPGRDSQNFRSFSLVSTTSRLWRQMHVVGSVMHEWTSLQQMAKWWNLPDIVHWGFHIVLPWCSWFHDRTSLLLCHFVIVSCSRVCLLVVSRLHGLTLRPFALVRGCHRDSLTRGRLASVQEAVRVFFFSVFSFGSTRDDMCPVVSGSLREMSLQAMLTYMKVLQRR